MRSNLAKVLRTSSVKISPLGQQYSMHGSSQSSVLLAGRAETLYTEYENTKFRNRKYKPYKNREFRRLKRTFRNQDGSMNVNPEIFAPFSIFLEGDRIDFLSKITNKYLNSHRHTLTPMPKEERAKFVQEAREFSEYKTAQLYLKQKDAENMLKPIPKIAESIVFLPTNLMNELINASE